jgi:hypothetical protein
MSSYALKPIEVDVLNWMRGKYDDPILNLQIDTLTVKNREYTKVGFFIDLLIPESIVLLGNEVNKFDGPVIVSKDIEHDGGAILFVKDGYISTLELYANGSFFRNDVSEYKLIDDNKL